MICHPLGIYGINLIRMFTYCEHPHFEISQIRVHFKLSAKHVKEYTFTNILGPKLMFAECDKHYPSRSGQTSLATAVTNITKPVTNINFMPGTVLVDNSYLSTCRLDDLLIFSCFKLSFNPLEQFWHIFDLRSGWPDRVDILLGPKLFFVTGLVIFVTAVARLVCPDLIR